MPVRLRTPHRKMAATRSFLSTLLNGDTWHWASVIGRWCGIAFGGALSIVALLGAARVVEPGLALWAALNAFLIGAGTGWATYFALRGRRRVISDPALTHEAKEIARKLNTSVVQNRLHREMAGEAMDLLEEASRSWLRIMEATDGALWRDPARTGSLQGVREQSRRAADRAMLEILVHIRPELRETGNPTTLAQGLQTALDALGFTWGSDDLLPMDAAALEPVRDATQDLSELAQEVEQVARQVLRQSLPLGQNAHESIRQTLAELHQIREARAELEVETRN